MKITNFKDIPRFTKTGSYQVDIPLNHLDNYIKEMQDDMGLQLNPIFQRGHVWTKEQQIAYVEFFLRGGKTSRIVYFNCPYWHGVKSTTKYNEYSFSRDRKCCKICCYHTGKFPTCARKL